VSSYRVALTASAEKELQELPAKVVARIVPRILLAGGTISPEIAVSGVEVRGRLRDIADQEIMESHLARGEELDCDRFPELSTLSAAFLYQFMPVAQAPTAPEIVFVPAGKAKRVELIGVLAAWNSLWEAAQYRKEAFNYGRYAEGLPAVISWMDTLPEANVYLVAETKSRYEAYSPLYHLLPKRLLDRHKLPALKRPLWPNNTGRPWHEMILPSDFSQRLSRAFAEHVWPYLDSGSGLRAFSSSDPLILLSHNLDFWLPHAITVIENRMREFERVDPETAEQHRILAETRDHQDEDVLIERPRKGGILWIGEEEAECATEELVNAADQSGQLRGLIDAVRSNRIVDDFSPHWSFAREDFERKLYAKRSKFRVSFVELKDTRPVHGPRSEYTDNLLWQDFSAFLDARERHIVVCLRNGTTKLGDIAASLGLANHSPVSKALARIRRKALEFLN
jgi:hypothetical protein